jgi:hypothetical protein
MATEQSKIVAQTSPQIKVDSFLNNARLYFCEILNLHTESRGFRVSKIEQIVISTGK